MPRTRVPHVPGVNPPGSRVAAILTMLCIKESVHVHEDTPLSKTKTVMIPKHAPTFWDTKPKPPKVDFVVPHDPLTVFTNITVHKNGYVRVKISAPMEEVYRSSERLPLSKRIKAAKAFGYPDKVLEYMIEVDDWYTRNASLIDEEFEATYRKYMDSKPSKPKLKSLRNVYFRK